MFLGISGGYNNHSLCPLTDMFHALVPRGSTWIEVPERFGPIRNHLYGGRLSSPIF